MSSHREAPEISKDPVADSTDVYAFVSPDRPDTVTLIANFIPFQKPDGGPNFYEFGDDVALRDPRLQQGQGRGATSSTSSSFHTKVRNHEDVPLQHRADHQHRRPDLEPAAVLLGHPDRGRQDARCSASDLRLPAGQRRPAQHARTTPTLAGQAVHDARPAAQVFAGQRADAFHVDLGSIFDLGRAAAVQRGCT